jgi:hypothetical protein
MNHSVSRSHRACPYTSRCCYEICFCLCQEALRSTCVTLTDLFIKLQALSSTNNRGPHSNTENAQYEQHNRRVTPTIRFCSYVDSTFDKVNGTVWCVLSFKGLKYVSSLSSLYHYWSKIVLRGICGLNTLTKFNVQVLSLQDGKISSLQQFVSGR